jgi:microcystin-dependent protein
MAQPYIGQIIAFAGNFAISGWAFCNGQLLSIQANNALFAILGTTYGGNGTTNFALPNLQGSFPMHFGNGFVLGEKAGSTSVTLTTQNLPSHTHNLMVSSGNATQGNPVGATIAVPGTGGGKEPFAGTLGSVVTAPTGPAAPTSISLTGGNIPVSITPPYVAVNYLIALVGVFPSRN